MFPKLEPEIWAALREICQREGCELEDLAERVSARAPSVSLEEALQVLALEYFREAAHASESESNGDTERLF